VGLQIFQGKLLAESLVSPRFGRPATSCEHLIARFQPSQQLLSIMKQTAAYVAQRWVYFDADDFQS